MLKVLLVDDNPIFLETVAGVLRTFPEVNLVGACRSGAEAVAVARATRPDLALVDIHMPVLNGLATAALLRAERPELLIVLTSMHRQKPDAELLQRSGADDFIWKPDLFTGIPALVERAVRIARLS
jgi:DNA-binding NarL/FixJ family response regulator